VKQLNINITKANLKSYTVELEDGKPVISATVNLLTEGGMEVTTYTASTREWYNDNSKFELPLAAIQPIIDLAKVLEDVVVTKCRDSQLALSYKVDTEPIKEQDLVALVIPEKLGIANDLDEIDDKPIDLSDIPF